MCTQQKWNSLLACVRACMWASHTLSACPLLLQDSSVFSVCIYKYTLRVCVHIFYYLYIHIYIYFLIVVRSPEYEHVPLCSRWKFFTESMRWLSFGLVGRQPFFHYTSACFFLTVFSISVTLFFCLFYAIVKHTGARLRRTDQVVCNAKIK